MADAALGKRKTKNCNCKNSRCLKLYCECFASGQYCEPGVCNCQNCFNNRDNELVRAEAVESTLERNPSAFRPKIAASTSQSGVAARHHKGCHCKKSGCLKKYCECFQAGILCTDLCKCMGCKNFEGSLDLQDVATAARTGTKRRARPQPTYTAPRVAVPAAASGRHVSPTAPMTPSPAVGMHGIAHGAAIHGSGRMGYPPSTGGGAGAGAGTGVGVGNAAGMGMPGVGMGVGGTAAGMGMSGVGVGAAAGLPPRYPPGAVIGPGGAGSGAGANAAVMPMAAPMASYQPPSAGGMGTPTGSGAYLVQYGAPPMYGAVGSGYGSGAPAPPAKRHRVVGCREFEVINSDLIQAECSKYLTAVLTDADPTTANFTAEQERSVLSQLLHTLRRVAVAVGDHRVARQQHQYAQRAMQLASAPVTSSAPSSSGAASQSPASGSI